MYFLLLFVALINVCFCEKQQQMMENICYQANGVNWACCNPVFIIAHFSTFYERVNVVEV